MKTSSYALISLAVTALVLSGSGMAAATGSEKWYPDHNGSIYDVAPKGNAPAASTLSVQDSQLQYWTANAPAAASVQFPASSWAYSLNLAQYVTGTFKVCIAMTASPDGSQGFTTEGCTTVTGSGTGTLYTGSISVPTFTVPAGKYLAFYINNLKDADKKTLPATTANKNADKAWNNHRVVVLKTGDAATFFQSPMGAPNYPTPELASIVLVGAGIGVVGLVVSRRR